jgi:hypothetical protein
MARNKHPLKPATSRAPLAPGKLWWITAMGMVKAAANKATASFPRSPRAPLQPWAARQTQAIPRKEQLYQSRCDTRTDRPEMENATVRKAGIC